LGRGSEESAGNSVQHTAAALNSGARAVVVGIFRCVSSSAGYLPARVVFPSW
jgi:hypothetical protein